VGVALLVSAPIVRGQEAEAPDTIILTGNPMGGVKLEHKLHSTEYGGGDCETCHHESKPEKPLTHPQQKCSDCHTRTPEAPMTTKVQAAFHNPVAKEGICIDCHLEQNEAGMAAPTTCTGCHKRENK
jgi:hypothetical protein